MAEADNMANSWCEGQLNGEAVRRLRFPIVLATEPPFNFREAAIAWAREHGIVGEMTDVETNGKGPILISVGSLREMLNPVQIGKSCSLRAHFAAVSVLRELIGAAAIVESYFDRKKGRDGIRRADNGVNTNVLIEVVYAAMRFEGALHRVKLTLKRFADQNAPTKAYAYHVTQIEVLAGTIGNDLSDTAPQCEYLDHESRRGEPQLDRGYSTTGCPQCQRGAFDFQRMRALLDRLHAKMGDLWWYSLMIFVACRSGDAIQAVLI